MGIGGGFRGGVNICIVSCEGQSPHDGGGERRDDLRTESEFADFGAESVFLA